MIEATSFIYDRIISLSLLCWVERDLELVIIALFKFLNSVQIFDKSDSTNICCFKRLVTDCRHSQVIVVTAFDRIMAECYSKRALGRRVTQSTQTPRASVFGVISQSNITTMLNRYLMFYLKFDHTQWIYDCHLCSIRLHTIIIYWKCNYNIP